MASPVVCEPCKKRKKSCNKGLPVCSRCSRLGVKCSYSDSVHVLPPLVSVAAKASGHGPLPGFPSLFNTANRSLKKNSTSITTDEQVSIQTQKLLGAISRKSGNINTFCDIYFSKFHHTLPILDQDVFYWQLENLDTDSHFSTLLLAIFLIAQLVSEPSATNDYRYDIYPTLKSIYSLLQSTGKVTHELIQAGLLVASFEYCQALFQDAWLSVGACVRMAQILNLRMSVRKVIPGDSDSSKIQKIERCLWWGVVIVERLINTAYKDNTLSCASEPPHLDDLLPFPPGEDGTLNHVRDDLVLPQDLDASRDTPTGRGFTIFSPFAATIQATYLATLVASHCQDDTRDASVRDADAVKLDLALQSYLCALIPPPGEARGVYCGAFGVYSCAAFSFKVHEFEVATRNADSSGAARAKFGLQSQVRTSVHMARASYTEVPIDFNGLAYWSHRLIPMCALMHIRFGDRNSEWQSDLNLMKRYIRGFESRYKLYGNYLREVVTAEAAANCVSTGS